MTSMILSSLWHLLLGGIGGILGALLYHVIRTYLERRD